jgi:uncharacterized GH25 family protein
MLKNRKPISPPDSAAFKVKQFTMVLGPTGWLLATIMGCGLCLAQTESKAPVLAPTLRGVVLATNGEPITNATVTIKGVLAGRGAVYIFDSPDCNRETMTKADGSFAFEGLAAKTKFQGVVAAPGYELREFWRGDPAGEPLEIKLPPARVTGDARQTVFGHVVNADRKPVAGAKIQVHMLHTQRDWHSGGGVAFTDSEGRFTFRPGEDIIACDFFIEANGYIPRSFSEIPPGAGTNEYELNAGTRIMGRLLKDGKPVPDVGIGIYGVSGGNFLNHYSVVTDGGGKFSFSGIPAHEEFHLFGMMQSLRELGALPRQLVKTGDGGTSIDVGDLNLVKGYTISGRVQMADGKPTRVAAFTLARTVLTPKPGQLPTAREDSNRSFYGLEHSFDNWRADPGMDGKFEFTGVPGETVSIFLMLKPFDMVSPRNISSDGKGFRLLGTVVSNKTDLVIELEPHNGQVFPPARDYEALSHQPLLGAEAKVSK